MPWQYDKNFPVFLEEAKRRFYLALDHDPFPQIEGALLNSAHIEAYAREAALIFEFRADRLKTATYPGRVGKRVHFWDAAKPDDAACVTLDLELDQPFVLQPFSLIFVETEEIFFLPHYIAARFNLQIEFVHKGLLLGTGPIVDPGFAGPLLIPLHNFTTNTYKLSRGQEIIWVEFTKTSKVPKWIHVEDEAPGSTSVSVLESNPKVFPPDKRFTSAEQYLDKARWDRSNLSNTSFEVVYKNILNAIPPNIETAVTGTRTAQATAAEAHTIAKEARTHTNQLSKWGLVGAGVTLLAIAGTLTAIFIQSYQLGSEILEHRRSYLDRAAALERQITPLQEGLSDLAGDSELRSAIKTDVELLKQSIAQIQEQLRELAKAKAEVPSAPHAPITPKPAEPKQ